MESLSSAFKPIRTFVFDVDGVMTDARVLVTETGALLRTMSIRDGYAIQVAVQRGYRVAIITGGTSEGVRLRFLRLGVDDYYSGIRDKVLTLEAYHQRHGLDTAETLYMGDDMLDIAAMRLVGLACAPSDAIPQVLAVARYTSPRAGGAGCVRDVIERVLTLNGHWPAA